MCYSFKIVLCFDKRKNTIDYTRNNNVIIDQLIKKNQWTIVVITVKLLLLTNRIRIDTIFNDRQKVKLDVFRLKCGNNDGDFVDIRYRSATYDRRLASRGRPHSIYKHSHLVIYLIKASLIHRPDKFIRQFRMICEPISRGRTDKKPAFGWFITVDLISPSHVDKFIEKWIEWRFEFSIVPIIIPSSSEENQLRMG